MSFLYIIFIQFAFNKRFLFSFVQSHVRMKHVEVKVLSIDRIMNFLPLF